MLVLPIKKEWFEMIAKGEKKEEYRELKPYYHTRIKNTFGFDYKNKQVEIVFRNGYKHNSPSVKCLCSLSVGTGKKEWGAEEGKKYYILEILEIIEIRNWDNPNPNANVAMATAALPATRPITPEGDMQDEIRKAIEKQIGLNIDIGEALDRSESARKNTMMFGG